MSKECREGLYLKNIDLAHRILKSVVSSRIIPDFESVGVQYKDEIGNIVEIEFAGSREEAKALIEEEDSCICEYIPDNFKFPVVTFNYDPRTGQKGTNWVSVPYGIGVLPEYVVGSDDKGYLFSNAYVFNMKGCAEKLELIQQLLNTRDLPPEALKVNFMPQESDSRFTALSEIDYKKIHKILLSIESGKFTKVKTTRRKIIDIERLRLLKVRD